MKKILASAIFLIAFTFASGQDTTSHCNWKASALSVHTGMVFFTEFPLSIQDMEKIAPSSTMLHDDFTGFYSNSGMNSMLINGSSEFTARLDLQNSKIDAKQHVLRTTFHAGFNYSDVLFSGSTYWKNYNHRYDTITSGNLTLYMDSAHYENYNFQWDTKVASLDFGQDFHSNDRKIFSAGFGYGILIGMGMNSQFHASHSIMDMIQATSSNTQAGYYSTMSESDSTSFEFIRTKSSPFARIYFPMYVQFRFSRKDNFFNHLAITISGKTGIDLLSVPGLGLQSRPFYAQSFGFKFYFEKNPMPRKRYDLDWGF